jgi:hypothetical protein
VSISLQMEPSISFEQWRGSWSIESMRYFFCSLCCFHL